MIDVPRTCRVLGTGKVAVELLLEDSYTIIKRRYREAKEWRHLRVVTCAHWISVYDTHEWEGDPANDHFCDNPATQIDGQYPYGDEYTRCSEHADHRSRGNTSDE